MKVQKKSAFLGLAVAGLVIVVILVTIPNLMRTTYRSNADLATMDSLALAPQNSSRMATYVAGAIGGPVHKLSAENQSDDRKIIHTAWLDLKVTEVRSVASRIEAMTEAAGGFVENSTFSQSGNGPQTSTITIRVPQGKALDIRNQIKRLAEQVESDKSEAKDVTRDFIDSEARLKNYRAEEAQYLEIMRRARSIDDTVEVTEKLSEVCGQIEQLQGELNYLSHQIEMTSITISLRTEASAASDAIHWRPLHQSQLALHEMLRGFAEYADAMLAFLFYLPVLILWGLTLVLLLTFAWRIIRWSQRRFFPAKAKQEGN